MHCRISSPLGHSGALQHPQAFSGVFAPTQLQPSQSRCVSMSRSKQLTHLHTPLGWICRAQSFFSSNFCCVRVGLGLDLSSVCCAPHESGEFGWDYARPRSQRSRNQGQEKPLKLILCREKVPLHRVQNRLFFSPPASFSVYKIPTQLFLVLLV